MRRIPEKLIPLAILCLSLSYTFAQDPDAMLVIRGDVQKPAQWSIGELKSKFAGQAKEIKLTAGMDKAAKTGTGIPLYTLIQSVSLKTDPAVKHHDLRFLVMVEAKDGYRVFFSLPELMPQAGNAEAWLLWDVDGSPLSGKEAPFRLVVSTDKGADRHIFGVNQIVLIDGVKVAGQYSPGK